MDDVGREGMPGKGNILKVSNDDAVGVTKRERNVWKEVDPECCIITA